MAEQIYSGNTRKIMQNKKTIESSLKIRLFSKNNILTIEGEPENEYIAIQAIEAINLGFPIKEALQLKNENFVLEKINIKSISKRKNLSQVRARIVGEKGRALRTIKDLSNCFIVLHDNTVGIIGYIEDVKKASYALKRLIAGSKHANIYRYLEEQRALQKAGLV